MSKKGRLLKVLWHPLTSPFGGVEKVVERTLVTLPEKYTRGLGSVILRDVASLSRKERAPYRVHGRTHLRENTLGSYFAPRHHKLAHIEILVDNLFASYPRLLYWTKVLRPLMIRDTLFHEIGHHVALLNGRAGGGSEADAEKYRDEFERAYYRVRFPRLTSLIAGIRRMQKK